MAFETELQTDIDKQQYKKLKADALRLVAGVTVCLDEIAALRTTVSAAKQAELDNKREQFVAALQALIGG